MIHFLLKTFSSSDDLCDVRKCFFRTDFPLKKEQLHSSNIIQTKPHMAGTRLLPGANKGTVNKKTTSAYPEDTMVEMISMGSLPLSSHQPHQQAEGPCDIDNISQW